MSDDQQLNIVILGASFAGLSTAHALLDRILPELEISHAAGTYRVVLISPSTHFYWNIAAPRALVSSQLIPHANSFVPITSGFEKYSALDFQFIHGTATLLDRHARTITMLVSPNEANKRDSTATKRSSHKTDETSTSTRSNVVQTIRFHSLILATGTSSDSPLFSLNGAHEKTISALDDFHARLRTANSILIAGGGPTGVETAGQLSIYFNDKPALLDHLSCFSSGIARDHATVDPPRKPKTITLISGSERLLPTLKSTIAKKAEATLRSQGVHILHNVRVVATREKNNSARTMACHLNNDTTINADLYIACTGVRPNTSYLSSDLLDRDGYVLTDPKCLRVPLAGPRVYAIGDCASYSANYTRDIFDAIPVLAKNLANDLVEHELKLRFPTDAEERRKREEALVDRSFERNRTFSWLMPCSKRGGVGVISDRAVPSSMVHFLKGKTYLVEKARAVVTRGKNPYAMK
ncbi:FAD/NAD(P)-binding domain-containing protein [Saccharata proteae CBS 121410]|uniref:FAD/NAD(P)-binding domain-containing protein n=1 Tax=Saccharata proteae CBS 121410 TaxID=1314787 RepID=A0A9P4LZB4_9PEZI|nr:FAD/NAD(P)-binding domain-containing protein [Saccharata proteae CBS 121410]